MIVIFIIYSDTLQYNICIDNHCSSRFNDGQETFKNEVDFFFFLFKSFILITLRIKRSFNTFCFFNRRRFFTLLLEMLLIRIFVSNRVSKEIFC